MSYQKFLNDIADKYDLSGDEKEVFCVEFEDFRLNKTQTRIAQGLNISLDTLEARMTSIYKKFSKNCTELSTKSKGKLKVLGYWLQKQYEEKDRVLSLQPIPIDWQKETRKMLDNLKRLTTEALTAGDGIRFDFDDVFVPLGVVERREKTKRKEDDGAPDRGSELYEEKVTPITHGEFFKDVLLRSNTKKRIAVIGEAGAGKTTQLQKIGSWLLEKSDDIPIWISLTELGTIPLEEFIFENWVRNASGKRTAPQDWKDSLEDAIASGKVWLLLDAVDEMTVSKPLSYLSNQLKESWLKNVRVVLTCRVNVWDGVTGFDVYRNLDFDYPDDVYKFIGKWFAHAPELAGSLTQALEQSGKERIRDMVKNPLRLTLLCYSWQLKQGELPKTKAGLYKWFVEAFYKWNKGKTQIELSRSQEDELNRALGELAKRAIDGEISRFRLTKTFIENVLREFDIDLFDLALKLNWLNEVGVAAEDHLETVYAFYHPSFQEYFAALAINDWNFFLPNFVKNRSNTTTRYRVFESPWKEVILFWVGHDRITDNCKEEFIKKLIEFDDNCGEFYSFRTYLLAAEAIAEFKNCSTADSIVEQVMIWGFGAIDRTEKEWLLPSDPIQKSTLAVLPLTDCKRVTISLCQMIDNEKAPNEIRHLAIKYLGFVALTGEERKQAINALINVIAAEMKEFNLCRNTTTLFSKKNLQPSIEDREKYQERETNIDLTLTHSAWSLGVIAIDEESAIHALINLIDTLIAFPEDMSTYANALNQAAWSLGQITFEQAKELSIPALIRLMEASESDFPYCQASSSLLKIANGERDEVLIRELISLLERSASESVRKEASSFLRLLVLGEEWKASNRNSSSKLTYANKEKSSCGEEFITKAILDLIDLSVNCYRESTRNLLSLMAELNNKDLSRIVLSLRESLSNEMYEDHEYRYNCISEILWECSKYMNYPNFYSAWNDKPKLLHPEIEDNSHTDDIETVNQLNSLISDS